MLRMGSKTSRKKRLQRIEQVLHYVNIDIIIHTSHSFTLLTSHHITSRHVTNSKQQSKQLLTANTHTHTHIKHIKHKVQLEKMRGYDNWRAGAKRQRHIGRWKAASLVCYRNTHRSVDLVFRRADEWPRQLHGHLDCGEHAPVGSKWQDHHIHHSSAVQWACRAHRQHIPHKPGPVDFSRQSVACCRVLSLAGLHMSHGL